jgi:hypothetical protein
MIISVMPIGDRSSIVQGGGAWCAALDFREFPAIVINVLDRLRERAVLRQNLVRHLSDQRGDCGIEGRAQDGVG